MSADLEKLLMKLSEFGCFEEKLNAAGTSRFGSGWAWLIVTKRRKISRNFNSKSEQSINGYYKVKGTPILESTF